MPTRIQSLLMNRKRRRAAANPKETSNPPSQDLVAGLAPPESIAELFALGRELQEAGRLRDAEICYRRILGLEANHAEALHLLGIIAHQTGRHDLAVEAIGQAIKLNKTEPAYFSDLGNALLGEGKLEEAASAYRQAISLKPDFAEPHANLGAVLEKLGNVDEAIAAYRQAINIEPDNAITCFHLSALEKLGRVDEAIAAYHQAITIKPDDAATHSNPSAALEEGPKLDNGRNSLEKAHELEATDPHTLSADVKRSGAGATNLAAIERLARELASLSPEEHIALNFALAKAYGDLEKHEKSFRHLLEGNALKRLRVVDDEPATLAPGGLRDAHSALVGGGKGREGADSAVALQPSAPQNYATSGSGNRRQELSFHQDFSDAPRTQILIEGIKALTLHNGVMRVECIAAGPNTRARPSGTLLIPSSQVAQILRGLVQTVQDPAKRLGK
jgi:Flp pilus assembly protein TadD